MISILVAGGEVGQRLDERLPQARAEYRSASDLHHYAALDAGAAQGFPVHGDVAEVVQQHGYLPIRVTQTGSDRSSVVLPLPRKPERMISSLRIPSILPCGEEPRPEPLSCPFWRKLRILSVFSPIGTPAAPPPPPSKPWVGKGGVGEENPSSEGFPLPSILCSTSSLPQSPPAAFRRWG